MAKKTTVKKAFVSIIPSNSGNEKYMSISLSEDPIDKDIWAIDNLHGLTLSAMYSKTRAWGKDTKDAFGFTFGLNLYSTREHPTSDDIVLRVAKTISKAKNHVRKYYDGGYFPGSKVSEWMAAHLDALGIKVIEIPHNETAQRTKLIMNQTKNQPLSRFEQFKKIIEGVDARIKYEMEEGL